MWRKKYLIHWKMIWAYDINIQPMRKQQCTVIDQYRGFGGVMERLRDTEKQKVK